MQSVIILGASADRAKFGNKAVRAFHARGWKVFPVNPKESNIEGLRAYPNIVDVPARPHWVSVYLPPAVLLKVLPDIAVKGCEELWLNPGTESPEVLAEVRRMKINVVTGCSLLAIGISPASLSD